MVAAGYPQAMTRTCRAPHHGRMRRRPTPRNLARALVVICLATALTGVETSSRAETESKADAAARRAVQVGTLTLQPCKVVRRAFCGSIRRDWDPDHPAAGKVKVGFAFVPARTRPAVGTLVPHEGGPGYATTESGSSYVPMYGGLMDRRNLLLVDQRGTGSSEPIRCPRMQNMTQPFKVAAGQCGRSLGRPADDYSTERSADDLAAVLEALELDDVDLYGDSYGTFFTQVFAGRHPDLVRSISLDASYSTYGESGWFPHVPAGGTPVLPPRLPAVPGLPERRPTVQRRHQAGARQGARPAMAWPVARRRRPADAGAGQPLHAGGRRVLRGVHAGVLPRADRCPALRAARRPRPPAPPGRRGDGRRHRLRALAVLQRRARGGGVLPRLPVRLRHDQAAREGTRARVQARAAPADAHPPAFVRPVHGPRVRALQLAGARLVHALADRAREQPGRPGAPSGRRLSRRARARSERASSTP